MKKLKYIIVGSGRCGTVYMSKWMTKCGIPCGHESIFTPLGIGEAVRRLITPRLIEMSNVSLKYGHHPSDIVADSSYMAAPFLNEITFKDAIKIHITRHPLLIVRSFVLNGGFFKEETPSNIWENFIYKHVFELNRSMTPLERACMFYVKWTKMIKNTHYFHRMEDDINSLAQWLKVAPQEVSRFTNTWKKDNTEISLKQIPNGEIKQSFISIGESQGYDMRSPIKLLL